MRWNTPARTRSATWSPIGVVSDTTTRNNVNRAPTRTRSSVSDSAPGEAGPCPTAAPMSETAQPTESIRKTGTTAATARHTATPRVRGMLARGSKRTKAHRSWAPRRSRCHQRRTCSSASDLFNPRSASSTNYETAVSPVGAVLEPIGGRDTTSPDD